MKKKGISAVMSLLLFLGCMIPHAQADDTDHAIDMDKTGSMTIYKIDYTNARKDGVWKDDSFLSTGWRESYVENTLINNTVPKGAASGSISLGNGDSSLGYALSGVEFTYLKIADICTVTETDATTGYNVRTLFQFRKDHSVLPSLGLTAGVHAYTPSESAKLDTDTYWYYTSDALNQALAERLEKNPTTTKNTLEAYVADNGGTAMPLSDNYGRSSAKDLPLGLYLLVETAVPEMVTSTTNPFFIMLPMTTVSGDTNSVSPAGQWNYDVTVYPKHETGIPTLEKFVREANSGKKTSTFSHTVTASAGDTVEYQILTTLPSITSTATQLNTYGIFDTLANGLSYQKDAGVKIEIYSDKDCTNQVDQWKDGSGNFTVTYSSDGHSMTVAMTAAGLKIINGDTGSNVNGARYSGYSNYTMRLSYVATVNSDASCICGDTGNQDKVVLTWRRSSEDYFDTLVDDTHVYSYGLNLTKKFSDQNSADADKEKKFDSVKFQVYNETDGYYVVATKNSEEGIYYMTGTTMTEKDATIFTPLVSDGEYGKVIILGLEDDTYVITETQTASGYTKLQEPISITITAAESLEHCDIYTEDTLGVLQNDPRYEFGNDTLANIPQKALDHVGYTVAAAMGETKITMVKAGNSANAAAAMTIINTPGLDLPQTGDHGTWMYGAFGVLFMVAAAIVIVVAVYKLRHSEK